MWSDIIRIFLTVVLSIAFLLLFGEKNIKRYINGGIAKIRDEEGVRARDIPIPGSFYVLFFTKTHLFLQPLQLRTRQT